MFDFLRKPATAAALQAQSQRLMALERAQNKAYTAYTEARGKVDGIEAAIARLGDAGWPPESADAIHTALQGLLDEAKSARADCWKVWDTSGTAYLEAARQYEIIRDGGVA